MKHGLLSYLILDLISMRGSLKWARFTFSPKHLLHALRERRTSSP